MEHDSGSIRHQVHASDLYKGPGPSDLVAEFAKSPIEIVTEQHNVDAKSVDIIFAP